MYLFGVSFFVVAAKSSHVLFLHKSILHVQSDFSKCSNLQAYFETFRTYISRTVAIEACDIKMIYWRVHTESARIKS